MKKNYKLITAFILLLSMFTAKLEAQLSGIYTINSGMATAGSNYQTFGAFATAINAGGVSGPVTVNVVANTGPYNEQVEFLQIAGTSSTNVVTINGNGNTITFAAFSSFARHTFMLSGADFFTVNNLIIVGNGVSFGLPLHLWNGSNNNFFRECTVNTNTTSSSSAFCPISLSGSASQAQSAGVSGSNNTFSVCTTSGGFWGVIFWTNFTVPYDVNNRILGCTIRDFHSFGINNFYAEGTIARNNTIERPNRTISGTVYGIFAGLQLNAPGMIIEGNRIRNIFAMMPGSFSSFWGVQIVTNGFPGGEIIVRNNLITDIHNNSTCFGIYNQGFTNCITEHNTVNFDSQISTGGTIYGIIAFGSQSSYRNNLVSITRTGSGGKYNMYFAGTFTVNFNILWNNSQSGTNQIGYDGTAFYTTFSQWQGNTQGYDQNSVGADPMFNNPAIDDYTPTNALVNNVGFPFGVLTDINGLARNLPAPDAGAFECFNQPCTGTPGANSVISPTFIVCSFSQSGLSLANSYTVNGITFQWGTSTVSALGPFTAISGGTLASIVTPTLPISTWFTATISCAGFGSPLITSAAQVSIATTVINQIPYFEDFEGVQSNNALPNCSWLKTGGNTFTQTYLSPQIQNRVPRSGNKFAAFQYFPASTNHFYTNGLQLFAGVTYSASMWFTTEYYGYNTWNLSMMVGPNQNTVGLVNIANLQVAASPAYKQLSNTFTVATSGIYYVAIRGISNAACCANYLSWDDLSVTIPCDLNPTNVSVNASSTSICQGQSVNLTALGANSYTWSTGVNTQTLSDTPNSNTSYMVVGNNTITGCSSSATRNVEVKPVPSVFIVSFNPNVCLGSSINLTAVGTASSFTWNTGASTSILTASPTSATTYTVIGTNAFGCTAMATQAVNVNPLPSITVGSNPLGGSCVGVPFTLNASGTSVMYQWVSSSFFGQGSSVQVIPNNTGATSYTVTGTDINGCINTGKVDMTASICTGIKSNSSALVGLSVYPNPTNGSFNIELVNGLNKTIEVSDVTGRIVTTLNSSDDNINMDIQTLANGIYYVTVKSNSGAGIMKIVKQ